MTTICAPRKSNRCGLFEPSDLCAPDTDRYALIARLDLASGKLENIARGVLNAVGFDCASNLAHFRSRISLPQQSDWAGSPHFLTRY